MHMHVWCLLSLSFSFGAQRAFTRYSAPRTYDCDASYPEHREVSELG